MGEVRRGAIAALIAGVLILVAATGIALWQGAQLWMERTNTAMHGQDSGEVAAESRERENARRPRTSWRRTSPP
jgi:Flp pilus assembly protein TadB